LIGDSVEFTAEEVGVSRFAFIQKAEAGFVVVGKELSIEVVEAIIDMAVDLGLTGEVIDKDL
jgi:hypothetical protein